MWRGPDFSCAKILCLIRLQVILRLQQSDTNSNLVVIAIRALFVTLGTPDKIIFGLFGSLAPCFMFLVMFLCISDVLTVFWTSEQSYLSAIRTKTAFTLCWCRFCDCTSMRFFFLSLHNFYYCVTMKRRFLFENLHRALSSFAGNDRRSGSRRRRRNKWSRVFADHEKDQSLLKKNTVTELIVVLTLINRVRSGALLPWRGAMMPSTKDSFVFVIAEEEACLGVLSYFRSNFVVPGIQCALWRLSGSCWCFWLARYLRLAWSCLLRDMKRTCFLVLGVFFVNSGT